MHINNLSFDMPSLSLPTIDLSRIESEWRSLLNNIPEPWKLNNDGREFQVGEQAAKRGLSAEFPVILIPGVVSTVSFSD
jgi:phospholipid:diacylglycerol acyltransferase